MGVVGEATSNWYGLGEGLMEGGYRVHLANPAARPQYNGLKYPEAHAEARWWAHVVRLGGLPEGSIDPKAERAGRDFWRHRAHWVRPHPAQGLRVPTRMARNPGSRCSAKRLVECTLAALQGMLPTAEPVLAVTSSLAVVHGLGQQLNTLAKPVHTWLKPPPAYAQLQPVDGIGTTGAQTIVLETGAMGRFPPGGPYAADCRGVGSTTIRTGKRPGQGNVKNGHPSREGASREAAPFALRFRPTVQRFSPRQQAQSPLMIARQAVAPTLARACYYLMRDLVPVDVHTAFGGG